MNLGDHRQGLIDQSDWDLSGSESGVAMFDRFINRALNQVALDAPFLFFESRFRIATQADVEPLIDEETLTIPSSDDTPSGAPNPWVFQVGASRGTSGMNLWPTNGSWDGRYIEITDENGLKHERRIRTIYQEAQSDDIRFTIDVPWDIADWGRGPFSEWRIYTPEYFVPDNVIELRSMTVTGEDRPYPLKVITQGEAEAYGFREHSSDQPDGLPTVAFRAQHAQIRGLSQAPLINAGLIDESADWHGPEPQGQFRYIATLCWGKRSPDWQNVGPAEWSGGANPWEDDTAIGTSMAAQARRRFLEPMFESAPSPESAIATVTPTDDGDGGVTPGSAVYVYLPNIEYALGFLLNVQDDTGGGTLYQRIHSRHSGIYVRIYRQRLSYDTTTAYPTMGDPDPGARVDALHHMEYDDAFYLLAELPLDSINEGVFIDDGSIIPDLHRRLRDVNGYMGVRLWPHPDSRYVVDIRAVRRPDRLVSAADVSPIHAEAADLVTQRAMVYLREKLHDYAGAEHALALYNQQLGQLKRRYGTAIPDDQVVRVHPTRWPPRFSTQRWRNS